MSENIENAKAIISTVGCLLAAKPPDQALVMNDQEVAGLQLILQQVDKELRGSQARSEIKEQR